jgi:hypothetical protein
MWNGYLPLDAAGSDDMGRDRAGSIHFGVLGEKFK